MRATIALSLLVLLGRSTLHAQSAGVLPRVAELPNSTRAMALGNAYVMDSGHADAIFYHPALLVGASGFGLEVQRWGSEATSSAASGAVGWFGGGVAIGLQTLQYTPGGFTFVIPAGQDHLFRTGPAVGERVASIGYARSIPEFYDIDVGLVAKRVEERLSSNHRAATLVDIGVARDVGPVTAALSWRNVGQSMSFAGSGAFGRPGQLSLGVGGYGRPVGPVDVDVNGHLTRGGGVWLPGMGVEVGYWPIQGRTFVGRLGLQRIPAGDASPLSIGLAYVGDDISVEWAFQHFGGAVGGGTYRVGVRWR